MRIGAPLAKVRPRPTRLDRFGAGLDVKDLEIEPVLLENAAALAELGNAGVPGAALRDCDLQCLLRAGDTPPARHDREHGQRGDERCPRHVVPPEVDCCSSRSRCSGDTNYMSR